MSGFFKLVVSFVSGLIILMGVVLFLGHRNHQANLDILVAPSGSTAKLDGHGVKSGRYGVRAGSHSLSVTRDGFASQTTSIDIKVGETKFLGVALVPNTPATQNWYRDHPKDQRNVESVASQQFDQASNQSVSQNPLLNKLPFIGPGFSFRIDYGVPSASSKNGQPSIYVRYRSAAGKREADAWLKNQGVDLSSLDIVYQKGDF